MKSMISQGIFASLLLVVSASLTHAVAGERPPADGKPLLEIISAVEDKGYTDISEVSMDDGVWEIEAYKDGNARELRVDPATAEVLSDRRDD